MKLTHEKVLGLTGDGRDRLVMDDTPGFGVRITPTGRKLFIAQARVGGRPRRITVGSFPDMRVADARQEAVRLLVDMRAGTDPVEARRERRQAAERGAMTVEDFAERWFAEFVAIKLKSRTADDYRKIIYQKIKPRFGPRALAGITRDDVSRWHASMAKTPRRANYVVAVFRSMWSFAEKMGAVPPNLNPAKGITLYRERQLERFLSEAEIGRVLDAIGAIEDERRISVHAAAALRLALLTGCRRGELEGALWTYVDLERRMILLPDSKVGKRTIFLSPAAVAILETLPRIGPFVVAGATADAPYKSLTRAWYLVRDRAGLKDVRLHDLRHTFASLAAGRGLSLQLIGRLLGHRVAATTARYAHLAADPVRAANDELGDLIASKAQQNKGKIDNVIKLREKTGPRKKQQKSSIL